MEADRKEIDRLRSILLRYESEKQKTVLELKEAKDNSLKKDELLNSKQGELDALKSTYDDFVASSGELEAELELQLDQTTEKFDELKKKNVTTESKFLDLQVKYSKTLQDYSKLEEDGEKHIAKYAAIEKVKRSLEATNDELNNSIRILQTTEEDLQHKLLNFEEEIIFLKTDLEEVQQASNPQIARTKEVSTLPSNASHHLHLHLHPLTQSHTFSP